MEVQDEAELYGDPEGKGFIQAESPGQYMVGNAESPSDTHYLYNEQQQSYNSRGDVLGSLGQLDYIN